MIKLGPMKTGIRKLRFHQYDLRWGDTLVDGWDSFVGWVHVRCLSRLLFSEAESPSLLHRFMGGGGSMPLIIDTASCNVTAEIAEE